MTAPSLSHFPSVLVVDDNPDVRDALGYMLAAAGFRVAEAPSAECALSFMSRQTVDLILTDIAMPKTDGVAFMQTVLNSEPPHPRMIAYTGSAFGKVDDARKVADAILTKPVTLEGFIGTIAGLASAAREGRLDGPADLPVVRHSAGPN